MRSLGLGLREIGREGSSLRVKDRFFLRKTECVVQSVRLYYSPGQYREI